jgi:hypothetical protein
MGAREGTHDEVAAKQAITEVLHQYARGLDRMDRALVLSCWHDGGTDDHAPLYAGTAVGFIDWIWPIHADMLVTRHVLSNILIDVNGDTAGSEAYWNVTLRLERDGQVFDLIGGGRYVDRFECIDGVWAIRHRQSISEWNRVEPLVHSQAAFAERPLIVPNNPEVARTPSRRDVEDYSYTALIAGPRP